MGPRLEYILLSPTGSEARVFDFIWCRLRPNDFTFEYLNFIALFDNIYCLCYIGDRIRESPYRCWKGFIGGLFCRIYVFCELSILFYCNVAKIKFWLVFNFALSSFLALDNKIFAANSDERGRSYFQKLSPFHEGRWQVNTLLQW